MYLVVYIPGIIHTSTYVVTRPKADVGHRLASGIQPDVHCPSVRQRGGIRMDLKLGSTLHSTASIFEFIRSGFPYGSDKTRPTP